MGRGAEWQRLAPYPDLPVAPGDRPPTQGAEPPFRIDVAHRGRHPVAADLFFAGATLVAFRLPRTFHGLDP